jgi:hypothetical protein
MPGLPPLGRRIDVRGQPPHELAAGLRMVDVEHDVRAVVRLGPVPQHGGLDVVEVDGDWCAGDVAAEAVGEGHGVLLVRIGITRR